MGRMAEDIDRGYLETGEPLEALYGTGWWSREQERDCPQIVQCFRCDGNAYDLGDTIDCENCGVIAIEEE